MSIIRDPLLTQGQAPPREKLFAKSNGLGADQNMTAKRRQGSNLQFEAMQSTSIPSLFDMCIKLLQNNIDDLPTLENIEDDIVIRILGNCEPHKLEEIEKKNEEENVNLQTDELWKRLVSKDFGAGLTSKVRPYLDEPRPHKELYHELNRERMEREYKIQKIKEDSKRMKQSSTRMIGSKTVNTSHSLNATVTSSNSGVAKHIAKTIDPIMQSPRIRNSSTRNRSSTSNDRPRTTSSAPTSKKSKLWTSSLGGESTTVRKKPEPTKNSVFIPGNITATNKNPMHMNRYTPPPLATNGPLVFRQPVVVSKANTIDYTKNRPSSPPTSDTIAGSPVVSHSYVENVFGKETSKRFERVKRQSNNDSSKLRDSTRATSQRMPPPTSNLERGSPKLSHPPPSRNSSSVAPPQKKAKPNALPLSQIPPLRSSTPERPNRSSSNSELNFTIPKFRK